MIHLAQLTAREGCKGNLEVGSFFRGLHVQACQPKLIGGRVMVVTLRKIVVGTAEENMAVNRSQNLVLINNQHHF